MLNISKNSVQKEMPQEKLYALRSLDTPMAGKILAKWILGIFALFFVILFLPWQQNIRGSGKVTALSPSNRPQTIETTIAGRIQVWKIKEGQFVNRLDTIAIISEVKEKYFDPQMLFRLQQVITAKERSLISKEQKAKALQRQVNALEDGLRNKRDQAKAKLEAERVRFNNFKNQYERNQKLFEAGNIPLTKFQDIEYKYQSSEADFVNAEIEIERVQAEYLDKINKAESDLNNTLAEQFDTQADIAKMRNELSNMQIRAQQYFILAPQAGFVVKATQAGIGETIKEGDPVCTIMPQSTDVAVEMHVKAMDVPLISKGRRVRIEFDGFPALQFSGWPSISVGTFGGTVEVIDYVNTKPGEFRILVIPDLKDTAWPKQIRVGSGIKGWVMLDDVSVWYELWRQLNGFPPSLYAEPEMEEPNKKKESKDEES
ncbi:MAG: HlyD family efflux transporter periplasmic adaptor subunit [Cytophagales bacterium]|jgi:multidrug resistance efflux pump|nr:HlyD family efflux transporter periplasmic adaptor subunit [Cytophagales bacterium]MCA6366927.1 HlyD family efflux transporter periplasmic adaptor subunit [Cytophagales bacterium]MCA6370983.1 HlyD family efflux transporter periplasmic adaptor subunit [Cytophagales bacterium]MCA6375400.1 HlyD family efflux transporter periplasmic adaptor subunit [Cytophagales bacterium]MCA6382101.1 HlyD family efflux transporter periplasmic adaptor subunit [Cytophagales bacterium]